MVRITEVLDYFQEPELVDWKVTTGKKQSGIISRRALKVGSRVDELIKTHCLPVSKDSVEVKNCFKAWQSFCKDYGINQFTVCQRFYIPEEDLTGEPDIYLPALGLTDIKCSSSIKDKYWLQLAKYYQGYHLIVTDSKPVVTDSNQPQVNILRLDKNLGIYEFVRSSDVGFDIDYGISVFDCLHTAYRYFNKRRLEEEIANGNSSAEAKVSVTDSKK